ncbi:MAG: Benzoyl-CoA oxygenase component B [Planctomycetes bacterium]|nr:Benzoyl-CoA oxygenase component B [Planctomycetota bacterium]
MSVADLSGRIPNNVNLKDDKRLLRALESWQPKYIDWWMEMGPDGFQADQIYLRTAISVDRDGWAQFGHVKMPEYRWGIFLADREDGRKIPCGDHYGKDAWQDVPGEHRNALRRMIVTQGDTEPASVEQQRRLGQTAPSLYDLRNLFQVNVEEGRHLWAMVYLLHSYFGRDGREEAEDLLVRRSGNADKPRILTTFNDPCEDWLSFFMFTTFTDRDGKFQLHALAESGFDPLSRTCRFMLTEESHHMFVGETGIQRVVKRCAEVMNKVGPEPDRVRAEGAIDLPTIQKYLNMWYTSSLDLFGGEKSSNAASYFAEGLKGRFMESKYDDHVCVDGHYDMTVVQDDRLVQEQIPLRIAMNEILRDGYVSDCENTVERWNKVLEREGREERLYLPNRRFNRRVGEYANIRFDPQGNLISEHEWTSKRDQWLPTTADFAYVKSLMHPVVEPGKIASWIAPPQKGINNQPFEFEYVRK